MKCPYCGWESENQMCDKCHAMIPADKPKETKEPKDDTKVYRTRKDKE